MPLLSACLERFAAIGDVAVVVSVVLGLLSGRRGWWCVSSSCISWVMLAIGIRERTVISVTTPMGIFTGFSTFLELTRAWLY